MTTPLAVAFEALGLLDGEAGMTESREVDQTDHFAWGGVLVRTTNRNHKRTFTVTALEDNDVVWSLVQPGSVAESAGGGVTKRTVKTPVTDPKSFVVELVDGSITKRRWIPRGEIVSVGDIALNDSEIAAYELTINIYPTTVGADDDVLYIDWTNDPQAAPGS